MSLISAIIGGLLLLAGLCICLINDYFALHNARCGTHISPVPLIGTMFMVAGLYLSAPWLGVEIPRALLLAAMFFDLSGLPALLLLPFALLLPRKDKGEVPPQPHGLWAMAIIIYILLVGGWLLRELLLLLSHMPMLQS